jgi:hypothetical protein
MAEWRPESRKKGTAITVPFTFKDRKTEPVGSAEADQPMILRLIAANPANPPPRSSREPGIGTSLYSRVNLTQSLSSN